MNRRRTDRGWHALIRENAYRDVWLLIITGVTVWFGVLAFDAARQAQDTARAIQAQRAESIRAGCEDQNARHDSTIRELNIVLARAGQHATATRRAQIATSRASTTLLINALAPRQNCTALANTATHDH